jgi:malate/lactate dehydrogenase
MEFTTITVCVTGAAGNIAYSLIPLIVGGHMFGPKTTIHLRLLDLSVCETLLKGVVMELEDSAYPLLLSTKYGSEPKLLFEACDIVIFLGGAARQPG